MGNMPTDRAATQHSPISMATTYITVLRPLNHTISETESFKLPCKFKKGNNAWLPNQPKPTTLRINKPYTHNPQNTLTGVVVIVVVILSLPLQIPYRPSRLLVILSCLALNFAADHHPALRDPLLPFFISALSLPLPISSARALCLPSAHTLCLSSSMQSRCLSVSDDGHTHRKCKSSSSGRGAAPVSVPGPVLAHVRFGGVLDIVSIYSAR